MLWRRLTNNNKSDTIQRDGVHNGESRMRSASGDSDRCVCISEEVLRCQHDDPGLLCCQCKFDTDNGDVRQSSVPTLSPVSDTNGRCPSSNSTGAAEAAAGTLTNVRSSAPDELGNRDRSRLVSRDGTCNVLSYNVPKRRLRYLVDIFTTLIDLRWRYIALVFTSAFVASWLFFGTLWYAVAYVHGDCSRSDDDDDDRDPCVANVYNFGTAVLFSMETQTTIGYGYDNVKYWHIMNARYFRQKIAILILTPCTNPNPNPKQR